MPMIKIKKNCFVFFFFMTQSSLSSSDKHWFLCIQAKHKKREDQSEILKKLQGNDSRSTTQEESRTGEEEVQQEMLMARWFSIFDDFLTFLCFSDVGVLSWHKLRCMLSFFLWVFSTSVNVSSEHERRCATVELFFLSRSSATSLMPWRDVVQP